MKYKLKNTKGRTHKLRLIGGDESLLLSQEVRNGDVL